ncbi:MAG: hypothetical protein RSF82_10045 [Angelakisella sp.]
MEAIISSVISAGAALIVAWFAYNGKMKDVLRAVREDLPEEHGNLSEGHKSLSGEHKSLSSEHKELSGEHKDIMNTQHSLSRQQVHIEGVLLSSVKVTDKTAEQVSALYTLAETERVKQDERYNALSEKGRSLTDFFADGIGAIQNMQKELGELSVQNAKLTEQISSLSKDNVVLQEQKDSLAKQVEAITVQNSDIVDDYNKLANAYNLLLAQQHEPPHHKPPNQTHEFDR